MGRVLVLAILALIAPAALSGQTLVVLHIRAVLTDATGRQTPLARYALLVSDEPQTRETRRVVTSVDGTADIRLRPGTYVIESDEPLALQGQAYRWRQTVRIAAGADAVLDLTLANAVGEPIAAGAAGADASPAVDASVDPKQWLDSVVEIWTPTAHASGFLIDAAGLLTTNQRVVGDASAVEVQLPRSVKVVGTVLAADAQRDVAIVRIDPMVMAAVTPVPLGCSRSNATSIARDAEIFTIAAPLRQRKSWIPGTVSGAATRTFAADLRIATGGTGGPVFTESGDLVGMTTLPDERDDPGDYLTRVVRIEAVCELLAAAATKATETSAPSGAHLPVEPLEPAPVAAFKEAVTRRAGSLKPYQISASDFDVTFITPILNYAAQQAQANQAFGGWSPYVADIPPVLFIRVTPKMEEGFWAKVARGAAYTQGMALPALERLKSGFDRLQAFCDGTEVTPVHPFKVALRVSETEAVHEGLYAFDPAALGPRCTSVTLALYSEKEPAKADTRVVDRAVLQQIWRDFEVGRNP
jgi:S1-C subfamily serine protease